MRKLETSPTYICDCCGEKLESHDGFVCFIGADIWDEIEHDWIEQDGKHYCPDCYTIDDDDNIIIKSN